MTEKVRRLLAEKEKLSIFVLMIVAYVPYFLMCYTTIPVKDVSDELGAIAGAAYLAGRDWGEVISYSGYYGFGWYAFFWWVFKLTNSPFIIYRVVVTVTAFLRILIIPISYYIMRYYLKMKADLGTYLTAALCPFLYSIAVNFIINEFILELMMWIILLLLCKLIENIDNKKEFTLYGMLLAFANGYVLLIHTRAIMLPIAIIMIMFAYMFLTKRLRKNLIIEVVNIICIYIIAKWVIAHYQQWIWASDAETGLKNTTVNISKAINIFSIKTWHIWLDMLIAHISTETLATGGIFLLCIIVMLIEMSVAINNKSGLNWYYIVAISISTICMGATICSIMLSSWFEGMYNTWGQEEANTVYSYKGMVYIRYWNVYIGPFIMCAICLLRKYSSKLRLQISKIFVAVYTILLTLYIVLVIPVICNNSNTAGFLSGLTGYAAGMTVDSTLNYKAILIATSIAIVFVCFYISKHCNIGIIFVIAFMLYSEYIYGTKYSNTRKDNNSNKILASYELKCELDDKGIYIENIYLSTTSSVYSVAQFYFNDYTLQIELPDELEENDIIITTKVREEIEAMYPDINCYVLDENEVWYTYLEISE